MQHRARGMEKEREQREEIYPQPTYIISYRGDPRRDRRHAHLCVSWAGARRVSFRFTDGSCSFCRLLPLSLSLRRPNNPSSSVRHPRSLTTAFLSLLSSLVSLQLSVLASPLVLSFPFFRFSPSSFPPPWAFLSPLLCPQPLSTPFHHRVQA